MRAVIACVAMAGAMTCAAAVTSRSYVQQGLVAQYDGIKNVGHDAGHNPNATTWVDLTGNDNNGTCADSSVFLWSANGWSVSGNCKPVTLGNGISAVTATGEFTIQFACTPQRGQNSGRQSFFSQYDGKGTRGIGIEHNGGSIPSDAFRLYSVPQNKYAHSGNVALTVGEWVQATVTAANGLTDIGSWKNGSGLDVAVSGAFTKDTYAAACPSIIGGEPNEGRDMAFRGTCNALRIYDRVLTADEMKINAAVDAIRFNGASWDDYPELSDYSFDDDGYLHVNFVATAEAGGKVKVDGGAAA